MEWLLGSCREAGDYSILQPPNELNYGWSMYFCLAAMTVTVGKKKQVGTCSTCTCICTHVHCRLLHACTSHATGHSNVKFDVNNY